MGRGVVTLVYTVKGRFHFRMIGNEHSVQTSQGEKKFLLSGNIHSDVLVPYRLLALLTELPGLLLLCLFSLSLVWLLFFSLSCLSILVGVNPAPCFSINGGPGEG